MAVCEAGVDEDRKTGRRNFLPLKGVGCLRAYVCIIYSHIHMNPVPLRIEQFMLCARKYCCDAWKGTG